MSKITLSYRIDTTDNITYSLKAWVSQTTNNIPNKLFLYDIIPSLPADIETKEVFNRTCIYADILNYPVDTNSSFNKSFRKEYVRKDDKSLWELYQLVVDIQTALDVLIDDIVQANVNTPVVYKTVTA